VVDLLLGTGPVVQAVIWDADRVLGREAGASLPTRSCKPAARGASSDRFHLPFSGIPKNLQAIHSASVGLVHSPVAQVFRAGYQELLQLTRAKRQAVGAEHQGFTTDFGRHRECDALDESVRRTSS